MYCQLTTISLLRHTDISHSGRIKCGCYVSHMADTYIYDIEWISMASFPLTLF